MLVEYPAVVCGVEEERPEQVHCPLNISMADCICVLGQSEKKKEEQYHSGINLVNWMVSLTVNRGNLGEILAVCTWFGPFPFFLAWQTSGRRAVQRILCYEGINDFGDLKYNCWKF